MTTSILKRWTVGGTLVGALALGGCGTMGHEQTWTMATTERIPSATGKVKVKEEKGGNTKVKVEVAHLAPPAQVFERASSYVVWVKPQAGDPQNVGVLNVKKDLKGELETRTAFKDFHVIVTAESDPYTQTPNGQPVMDTRVVIPT